MLKQIVAIAAACLMLTACGGGEEKKEDVVKKDSSAVSQTGDSCSKLYARAKASDEILMRAITLDRTIAVTAINDFNNYASYCKEDSLAPVFYVKAGQVAQAIGSYSQAQAMFNNCINTYPQFSNKGAVLFLLAQLYDEHSMLNNEEKAKEYYEQIIKEFPKSTYATDAQTAIKNLGKTDEELVKEFMKKNK